ncbi:p21-activated protein kinase-interacting protein 1-like [Xyrauchen texanus]|uniref:p21-activated protein kinase-interacting protein 1-like n=1 Tax=Xyrauchen texanus TaxID=154827 RepID=UPI0022428E20|nr:p21-activated protein kinase-interacting protein 1-like [Xyrauchen texanus]
MGDHVELVAGCYEQIVFGYRRVCKGEDEWTLVPNFTHHAHTASLTAVASNNQFIATGSKDETIQLYDMSMKTEHGALLHHDGTILCLEFCRSSHLLSGGEDGLICVWNTKKWECLKSIKAHKGHVTSLSVHPSGKLALSVGSDLATPSMLGQVNTTARLSCLSVWIPGEENETPAKLSATSKTVAESPMPANAKRVRITGEEVIIQEESSATKQGKKKKKT